MSKIKILLLFFFCIFVFYNVVNADTECSVVTIRGDRRTDKSKLRIVQYNVEWLFVDYYSPANCPGDGCKWKNQSEVMKHMGYISERIKDINPDIINFCEVEGCDELNMLKDQLDGSYLPYLIKGKDTSTGQNVGMLTRLDPIKTLYRTEAKHDFPIFGSTCGYSGQSGTSGVSKHFITEFEFNGVNVAFISAHFLAIPTDPTRCAQREAQASVLQSIIYSYISKNYELIVLGDFNDYDAEVLDLNNNKPTSQVLDILKGYKGEYAGKYHLQSIAENIAQNERYTNWWNSDDNCNNMSSKKYSMIDHILVSDWVKQKITNAFIYHNYSEYCETYDSDHYPIVIDLAL